MKTKPDIDKIIELVQDKKSAMNDKIIKDDEQSRKEFEAFLEVWEKSENLKEYESIDLKSDWKKVRSRMKLYSSRKKIPLRSFLIRIAAIVVFAFGLAYLLVQVMENTAGEAVYFEIASTDVIKKVELPDGSIVNLNRASKLIHNSDYGVSNRDIILEGEAFFNVARNETIPFKVHTLNSTIEVLGTQFDVKADSIRVVVGVVSGKVAFYENNQKENKLELTAENTGFYNAASKELIRTESFDPNQIAWHTRKFVFRKRPLEEVCQILADFYNIKLIAGDDVQFSEPVNLNCSTESLDEVLISINKSLVGNVRLVRSDNLLIVRNK